MTSQNTASQEQSGQRSADILRRGLTLLADHVAAMLSGMFEPALKQLAGRTDGDPGIAVARRFLEQRRNQIEQDFSGRLRQEQEEALARILRLRPDQAVPGTGKITADSLSLVEDDVVNTADIVSRVARRMHGPVELALREINVVTAHLAGRERIPGGDDAFAPEVCMKALLEVARELELETSGWGPLLAAFERPMIDEIARAYLKVLEHFRAYRVDVAAIRREVAARQALGRPTLNPATRGAATQRPDWLEEVARVTEPLGLPTGSGGQTAGGRGGWSATRSPGLTDGGAGVGGGTGADVAGAASRFGGAPAGQVRVSLDHMMARLSGEAHGMPGAGVLASPGAPPPDLLDAINEMQHLGARAAAPLTAGTLAPAVGVAGVDQGAWRDMLLSKSTRTVDKLTIEIVGMLFDHVLQDEQVPAEIKAVLSRLQFPVLKVALVDADFFVSSTHPARRLIDRLASTAVGWEPYGDENQRYKKEVERVVQQVQERFDKDLGLFDQLLAEFDAFIAEMPTREADPVARAKRALEEAEKREVLVINTTIQVRRAFEHVELEQYLRDFLVGPWVQALVNASLRDEQTPGFSKAFRQVIHDMVWSVQPKMSADERKRLVALIPVMTRVLRDGMTMIQMPESEQQNFLKQLMGSHAIAVRPVDQATYIKSRVATGELRHKLDEMRITGTFPISSAGGGVKVSLGALQRAAQHHSAQLVVPEPIAAQAPLSVEEDADFDGKIAAWQRGSWFNLYDGKEVIKVRLRWVSPLRTLFMFSNEADKSTRVLSPQTIKSYLKQGWLKPLETVPLTKRVADRVVGELERSPKRAEELVRKIGAGATTQPA